MAKNDIEIRAGISGADKIKSDLTSIANEVDKLGKKTGSIDVGSDFEATAARLGQTLGQVSTGSRAVASSMAQVQNGMGLTRQEALALTYTFNDVTASLASGISPMTILFQQGGQLTQAFGGIKNTLAVLIPQMLKFTPLVIAAGAGFAAWKAINVGEGAVTKLASIGDAADKAKVSGEQLQGVMEALVKSGARGVTEDVAADTIGQLRSLITGTRDAQKELLKGKKEFAKRLSVPGPGEDPFAKAAEAGDQGKFLKRVQPPAAGDSIAKINKDLISLKDPFSKAGQDVRGLNGEVDGLIKGLQLLKTTFDQLKGGAKLDFILDLEKRAPGIAKLLQSGNIDSFIGGLRGPNPNAVPNARIQQGQDVQKLQELTKFQEDQKKLRDEAPLADTAEQRAKAAADALKKQGDQVDTLTKGYLTLGDAITNAYKIEGGDQQAAAQNPNLKKAIDAKNEIGPDALSALQIVADQVGNIFDSIVNEVTGKERTSAKQVFDELQKSAQEFQNFSIGELVKLTPVAPEAAQPAQEVNAAAAGTASSMGQAAASTAQFATDAERAAGALALAAQMSKDIQFPANPNQTGSGSSSAPGFADGGVVSGPGTATSDSIAAWLSNGEYVVRAAAVAKPGVLGLLEMLNHGRISMPSFGLPKNRFADGGLVGSALSAIGAGPSGGRPLTLVLEGRSFDLSGSSSVVDQLERHATTSRAFSTMKRSPSRVG